MAFSQTLALPQLTAPPVDRNDQVPLHSLRSQGTQTGKRQSDALCAAATNLCAATYIFLYTRTIYAIVHLLEATNATAYELNLKETQCTQLS